MAMNSGLVSPVSTHGCLCMHGQCYITLHKSKWWSQPCSQPRFNAENQNRVLQVKSVSLKCYEVHKFPGWEFSSEKMNHILQKGEGERKRGKGKTELLFLDHNVLKWDLLFSIRFPSCPVSFFFFLNSSFFLQGKGWDRSENHIYTKQLCL